MKKNYNLQKIIDLVGGDLEFVKKLIGIFVSETPETIQSIQKAIEDKDFSTVKKLSHRLRPSVDNLGMPDISKLLLDLELDSESTECLSKIETISMALGQAIIGLKADIEKM